MVTKKVWPGQTARFAFKGPSELEKKVDAKVRELQARGIRTNKSDVMRICIERGIDSVEEFLDHAKTYGVTR